MTTWSAAMHGLPQYSLQTLWGFFFSPRSFCSLPVSHGETGQDFVCSGKVTFQEYRTQNKTIFVVTSVLKDQTFSDAWEVCFGLVWVFLFMQTKELGEWKEDSLFFPVRVYLHFWLQPKWNAGGRPEIYITSNAGLQVY